MLFFSLSFYHFMFSSLFFIFLHGPVCSTWCILSNNYIINGGELDGQIICISDHLLSVQLCLLSLLMELQTQ